MSSSFLSPQKDEPIQLKVIDTPTIPSGSEEHFFIIKFTSLFLCKIVRDYNAQEKMNLQSDPPSEKGDTADANVDP